jgi:asparagine synthase (glutamine-hydrolysing)
MRAVANWLAPSSLRTKLPRTFLWLPPDIGALYFDNFAVFPRRMQHDLFTRETKEGLACSDPYVNLRRYFDDAPAERLLDRLLYVDLKTYLHELLMKQDQMSMAASIESRVPFLDHKLVEFSMAMPERMKLRGWTTKFVLREAMKDILPSEIVTRPKMGFPVPVGRWLRGSFRSILEEYILSPRVVERGLFNPGFLEQLVAEHIAGVNHTERLWALVNLEIWQRHFIDGEQLVGTPPQIAEASPARSAA